MLIPNKYLSLYLGKEQVKVIYLSKSKYKITVLKVLELNIADLTQEDNEAVDLEKLAEALKEALKKAGIKEKKVIFSIYHPRLITREVELPNLPKDKLSKVIQANSQDYFPIDVTNYVVGHTVLGTNKEENKTKAILVAVPNQIMSQYMTLCKLLKLDLVGMDYEENSIAHFSKLQKFAGTHMVIHIGEEATTVIIGEDEKIQFTKTIPSGLEQMVRAVKAQYACSEAAAYDRMFKQNLLAVTSEWDVENELKNHINYLLNNINSYIKYYANRADSNPIQEVYLLGRGAKIIGLDAYIQDEIQISTGGLAVLNGVLNKDKNAPDLLGAGIEGNIGAAFYNVELLPQELVDKEKSRAQTRLVILISILIVLSVASILIKPLREIKELELKAQLLASDIELYQQIEVIKVQYDQVAEGLSLREYLMTQADTANDHLLELLEGLEDDMPTGITVQSLSSTDSGISMNCIAEDRLTVARFISTLKAIPNMGKVYVGSLSEVAGENTEVMAIQFAVTCTYEEVSHDN